MITMSSWVLSIPAADQELGFEGENLVHTLSIRTDSGPEWVYRIELAYADGRVDILLPEYKDGVLTAELRWTELCVPGTVTVQVRGTRGYKVKLSTVAVMYIRDAIHAVEVFNSGMPTEFEQLEQDLYAARSAAAASREAAEAAGTSAAAAAAKAASDASRAESARAAAELAAAGAARKFVLEFTAQDWGTDRTLVCPAETHGLGTAGLIAQVQADSAAAAATTMAVGADGSVTLTYSGAEDGYAGRLVLIG